MTTTITWSELMSEHHLTASPRTRAVGLGRCSLSKVKGQRQSSVPSLHRFRLPRLSISHGGSETQRLPPSVSWCLPVCRLRNLLPRSITSRPNGYRSGTWHEDAIRSSLVVAVLQRALSIEGLTDEGLSILEDHWHSLPYL